MPSVAGSGEGAAASDRPDRRPLVGVLAIQGGFEAHRRALERAGAAVREVRTVSDLEGVEGLVLPGGESTAIMLGIEREGLAEPIANLATSGRPLLGSCAGLILLDRSHLGIMGIEARRNAFGRQIKSFETDLVLKGFGEQPLRAVFIRAPWIERYDDDVEILADVDGHPVAARQGRVLAVAFHSELTDDLRLHRWLVEEAARSGG